MTLLQEMSVYSSIYAHLENSRVAVAELAHNARKMLWHRLLKERRLLSSVAVKAQGLSSGVPRLVPRETPW